MNTRIPISPPLIIIILAFLLGLPHSGYAIDIYGFIVEENTGKTLENAIITVTDSIYITKSNSKGYFSFNTTSPIHQFPSQSLKHGFVSWDGRNRKISWSFPKLPYSISLYNMKGIQCFNIIPKAHMHSCPFPEIGDGFYILRITGEQAQYHKKIVHSKKQWRFNFTSSSPFQEPSHPKFRNNNHFHLVVLCEGYHPRRVQVTDGMKNFYIPLERDKSSYVFHPDYLRTYELTIAQNDYDWLNNNAIMEEYVPAQFSHNNIQYGTVGIRYKGAYTLEESCDENGKKNVPKISMKIRFNHYNPATRFYGLKRLNLHSMKDDKTYLYNKLSYYLFSQMGVLAPRSSYCKVFINGVYEGLFAATEEIDGRFTDNRFPEFGNGNVYKEIWPCIEHKGLYQGALKTNNGSDDTINVEKMDSFQIAINNMNSGNFLAEIIKWIDYYYMMRYITVDRAIANSDGIMIWYYETERIANHNYFWYEEENQGGRFWLIPWDLDYAFSKDKDKFEVFSIPRWYSNQNDSTKYSVGGESYARPPGLDKLINLLAQTGKETYNYYGDHLLNEYLTIESMQQKIDTWTAQIDSAVANDPNGRVYEKWKQDVKIFRSSISYFRNMFQHYKQYPGTPIIPTVDNTPLSEYNGLSVSNGNSFELSTQLASLQTITANVNGIGTYTIKHNNENAISGNWDMVFEVIYRDKEGTWNEWSNLIFTFETDYVALNNYKYIAIDMKCDRKRNIRITLGSENYPDEYGVLSGWDKSIDTTIVTELLPIYGISYPSWGCQDDVLDNVLPRVSSLIFEPSPAFDNEGNLTIDPDTCILHIDNIQFIK